MWSAAVHIVSKFPRNVWFLAFWGLLLSTLLWPVHSQEIKQTSTEVRGLWVVRHTLKDTLAINRMLRIAQRIRMTDLFVQVRGRGDAFYQSNLVNKADGLAEEFDPLDYLLKQPLAQEFRIHLWINVYYLWSAEALPNDPKHIVYRNPEWLVHPANYPVTDSVQIDYELRRNVEGLYLSPHIKQVNEHLINVADDLLSRYAVSGLHLDYIRFADQQYDFHPVAREQFKAKYFIDPLDFKKNPDQFVANFGTTGYDIFYSRWGQFQRDAISGFVRDLSERLRSKNPKLLITAAVKPDIQKAYWQFYQQWDLWVKNGWIDFAIPMNYASSQTLFEKRVQTMFQVVDRQKLLMGISLYNQSEASALQKIRLIRRNQLPGFVLFSYDTIFQNNRLRQLLMR